MIENYNARVAGFGKHNLPARFSLKYDFDTAITGRDSRPAHFFEVSLTVCAEFFRLRYNFLYATIIPAAIVRLAKLTKATNGSS